MIPPTSTRIKPKSGAKRGARIRIPQADQIAGAALLKSIRKPVRGVSHAAGEIQAEAMAVERPTPTAPLSVHQDSLEGKMVTVKEAAYRLGKSTDAVYQWLRTGRLRGRQPGGRGCAILVLESSLNAALLCTFERASAGRGRFGSPPL